jgi:predicted RNA-binding Zn-ribbon protein involved in translation (DUF1610 family)
MFFINSRCIVPNRIKLLIIFGTIQGPRRREMKGFVAVCPHCHRMLTDADHPIGGKPGIQVKILAQGEEGTIWLSSNLGDLQIESGDIVIPKGEVIKFFCPHCGEKISNGDSGECDACRASMVTFIIEMEAEVCSRRGCSGHKVAGGSDFDPSGSCFW